MGIFLAEEEHRTAYISLAVTVQFLFEDQSSGFDIEYNICLKFSFVLCSGTGF